MSRAARTKPNDRLGSVEPQIRRGRVDSLTLYEITDYELDVLERGSPSSIELNFAVALLSIGVSLLVTLLTTNPSKVVLLGFLVTSVSGFVFGFYFLLRWYRTHNDVADVVAKIRARIAGDDLEQPAPAALPADAAAQSSEEQAG